MFIIKHKKIFLSISAFLLIASIVSIATFGLKLGIDFKGGALMEVSYTGERPALETAVDAIHEVKIGETVVQESGDKDLIVKSRDLTEAERTTLSKALTIEGKYPLTEKTFTSIGPSVGTELARKAIISIILVALAIIAFIAFAFRHVSRPVSSWKYGLIAVVTLTHDILIPSGVFALLGHFHGAEVDSLFVVALLTILGLSVSDTIVVFDRIRENLRNTNNETFGETVGKSLSQTFTRSINTSLTVIIALLALYFFGPDATRNFSLVLVVGMFFGTYSSIFVASPILVLVGNAQLRKEAKHKKK
jgi:preprotein translocase subunit SecF